jgi:hypothetical protein
MVLGDQVSWINRLESDTPVCSDAPDEPEEAADAAEQTHPIIAFTIGRPEPLT